MLLSWWGRRLARQRIKNLSLWGVWVKHLGKGQKRRPLSPERWTFVWWGSVWSKLRGLQPFTCYFQMKSGIPTIFHMLSFWVLGLDSLETCHISNIRKKQLEEVMYLLGLWDLRLCCSSLMMKRKQRGSQRRWYTELQKELHKEHEGAFRERLLQQGVGCSILPWLSFLSWQLWVLIRAWATTGLADEIAQLWWALWEQAAQAREAWAQPRAGSPLQPWWRYNLIATSLRPLWRTSARWDLFSWNTLSLPVRDRANKGWWWLGMIPDAGRILLLLARRCGTSGGGRWPCRKPQSSAGAACEGPSGRMWEQVEGGC